jgi:hypothetical protein
MDDSEKTKEELIKELDEVLDCPPVRSDVAGSEHQPMKPPFHFRPSGFAWPFRYPSARFGRYRPVSGNSPPVPRIFAFVLSSHRFLRVFSRPVLQSSLHSSSETKRLLLTTTITFAGSMVAVEIAFAASSAGSASEKNPCEALFYFFCSCLPLGLFAPDHTHVEPCQGVPDR